MTNTYLLIVHPDEPSRTMLRAMLLGLGHRIDDAPCYGDGLQILGHDPDALVLADAAPADHGLAEFLASMHRRHPRVPVILLRPATLPDLSGQALRQGATAVLRFPLPTNQLRAAVVHALDRPIANRPPRTPAMHLPEPSSAPRPAE